MRKKQIQSHFGLEETQKSLGEHPDRRAVEKPGPEFRAAQHGSVE